MNKKYVYTFKKETKSTYVYENPELGVYYLPKKVIGDSPIQVINVTLEP